MRDLICLGEMLIDFLPGSGDGVYVRMPGGAPANVAAAAARSGLNAGFCGRLGDDDFGRFLLRTLEQYHIHPLCPEPVTEAVTTMAFVSLDPHGDRTFTFARKPGADMFLTRADIDRARVEQTIILHAGSFSLSKDPAADATRYALSKAHTAERLISFDVNYRSVAWDGDREGCIRAVKDILPMVDFLKISNEEADMLGMPIQDAAREYNIAVLVETLGADGARFHYRGRCFHIPGHKVPCVDTTGAGDAFWGAFLSCLLHGKVTATAQLTENLVMRAVRCGNAAGSLCVQKKGAMESLPTMQEIQGILSSEA